jgi:hypothetical protein
MIVSMLLPSLERTARDTAYLLLGFLTSIVALTAAARSSGRCSPCCGTRRSGATSRG